MTRMFFGCDVHGSNLAFSKMLEMSKRNNIDVFMVCGDLTGKAIVPIIKKGLNDWYCAPWDKERSIRSVEELEKIKRSFGSKGYYIYDTTQEEVDELKENKEKQTKLFLSLMKQRLDDWLARADKELSEHTKIIISPGNDDAFDVDEVIKKNRRIVYPLQNVVSIDSTYEMISCEWTNPTPWSTPRECSENELKDRLEKEFERSATSTNLICNFHAPPFGTKLDIAPKLKDFKPVTRWGQPVMEHVGSTAVRETFQKYEPLIGLHGHIHESCAFERLGRTLCLNPGSEYDSGVMRGYIVNLNPEKKPNFVRVEA